MMESLYQNHLSFIFLFSAFNSKILAKATKKKSLQISEQSSDFCSDIGTQLVVAMTSKLKCLRISGQHFVNSGHKRKEDLSKKVSLNLVQISKQRRKKLSSWISPSISSPVHINHKRRSVSKKYYAPGPFVATLILGGFFLTYTTQAKLNCLHFWEGFS